MLQVFVQCPFHGITRLLAVLDRFGRVNQRGPCWADPASCGVDQKILSIEAHAALDNPEVFDVKGKIVAGGRFAEPALLNQQSVRIKALGDSPFYLTVRKVLNPDKGFFQAVVSS